MKVPQAEDFLKRQEERRQRRQPDQIYDITAWSLPLLFDVDVATSAAAINVKATPVPSAYDAPPAARTLAQGKVGYLMPWGTAAAALTTEALQHGVRIHSVGGAFTLNGRQYPIGTAVIRNAENPMGLHAQLSALATKHGAEIVPIDTTYIESGISLGSNENAFLKAPRVLMALGHADGHVVCRLVALRAGAAFRPAGHRGSHELSRARGLRRLRRPGAPVGQLQRRHRRCGPGPHQGLDPRRRHVGDDGRGDAVGDERQCGTIRDDGTC